MFYDNAHMLSVAECESGLTHYKDGGGVIRGNVTPSDTGVMQISLDHHQKEVDRLGLDMEDLYDNLTYARILYEQEGSKPWVCSRLVAQR